MTAMTADQARAFYDIGGPMLDLQPAPNVDREQNFSIPARDGHAMPARLFAPQSDMALPVLLYIHGGGFTVGSVAMGFAEVTGLARQFETLTYRHGLSFAEGEQIVRWRIDQFLFKAGCRYDNHFHIIIRCRGGCSQFRMG